MSETERWKVTQSPVVSVEFRRLSEVARSRGDLLSFVKSARWIHEELTRTPLEFGEGRYAQPTGRFLYRLAHVGPIEVDFAVDPVNRIVYYRQFKLRTPSGT